MLGADSGSVSLGSSYNSLQVLQQEDCAHNSLIFPCCHTVYTVCCCPLSVLNSVLHFAQLLCPLLMELVECLSTVCMLSRSTLGSTCAFKIIVYIALLTDICFLAKTIAQTWSQTCVYALPLLHSKLLSDRVCV